MNVVFIGASRFGYQCLEQVHALPGVHIVGIVTNAANFSISYRPQGVQNVLHANFHPFAQAQGIPIFELRDKMSDPELVQKIKDWAPDFILVVGWYHMIPKAIRALAPTAGMHASLLPRYSGGAPLVWAIINGETQTGISLFLMDQGVDSGPLIAQTQVPIAFEDTIAALYARIEQAGLELLLTELPKIANGRAVYTEQDESQRSVFPQRSPEDGLIDWHWPAEKIYNFIRAQTKPYPGAFTWIDQQKLTLWNSILLDETTDLPAGTYTFDVSFLRVSCGDSRLIASTDFEFQGQDSFHEKAVIPTQGVFEDYGKVALNGLQESRI